MIHSSDDSHFKTFNTPCGSAGHESSIVLTPKDKPFKLKKAPDNLKAIDYYVTTFIGAVVCGSIEAERCAHDPALCYPTVNPHFELKTPIIIASGEVGDALPKIIGKATEEFVRCAAPENTGNKLADTVEEESLDVEKIPFKPAKGELGEYIFVPA